MKDRKEKLLTIAIKKPWLLEDKETTIGYNFLKKITEFCCDYIPKPIRKIVLSVLYNMSIILSRLLIITNGLSLTIYQITGKEKNCKEPLIILYLSNEKIYPYLENIIFYEKPKIRRIGKIYIWNIKKKIKNISSNIDAVFIENEMFYANYFERQGFTVIPEFISMILDTSKSFEEIYNNFSKSAKEDTRKVKKHGFNYEISHDFKMLKLFYYKMYLPYMYNRHGKTAVCTNFHTMRLIFEREGKLLLIKLKNEYVFGGLFSVKNDKAIALYSGISDKENNLLQKGITAASYYFFIQWAKKNRIKTLDFGTSKPFFNDGLFKYKKKWGTTISKNERYHYSIFPFKICKNSKAIMSYLKHNPFIYLEKNKVKIKIQEKE